MPRSKNYTLKSNPFANYSATTTTTTSSSSSSGKWLQTKKRGRDDAEIERSKKIAYNTLQARRRSKTTNLKQRTKKKKVVMESESEDSFIVDDEEELSLDSSSSSSSGEEEEDIKLPKYTKKTSQTAAHLQRLFSSSSTSSSSISLKQCEKKKVLEESYSSSEEEEKDSQDSLLKEAPFFSKKKQNQQQKTSKNGSKKMKSAAAEEKKEEDDDDEEDLLFASPPRKKNKRQSIVDNEKDEDDEEEEDDLTPIKAKHATNSIRRFLDSDSDSDHNNNDIDEDADYKMALFLQQEENKYKEKEAKAVCTDDDFMDEDEATAYMLALQESSKEAASCKKLKRLEKKSKKTKYREETLFLQESEEEEEDEEEEGYEEEEEDEAKRQAGSILKKANELSSRVFQVMADWTSPSGKEPQTTNDKVPCGIIADGALAISTLGSSSPSSSTNTKNKNKNSSSAEYRWISQQQMQDICPQLKLADYQLIGVNWLALLHGMTYDITAEEEGGDSRKQKKNKTNNKKKENSSVNGVLADEMGLGKTVQTIAFLAWLRHYNRQKLQPQPQPQPQQQPPKNKKHEANNPFHDDDDGSSDVADDEDNDVICIDDINDDNDENDASVSNNDNNRPHIVIVPASVLSNWEREFHTFCPEMTVVKYHGSMIQRQEIQQRLRKSLIQNPTTTTENSSSFYNRKKNKKLLPLDVVLTTFSYFSTEKSDDRNFLRKFHFDYMVVDEAHCLKNPRGMRYKNMDKFVTSHRLLLTGTPVQNSPKELMSLLCFLMPLFTRQQRSVNDFEEGNKNDGGEKMLQHFVTLETANGKKKRGYIENPNEHAYRKLKQLLAPFILRRRKSVVLSQLMPPKTRTVEFVPFDEATKTVYDAIISSHLKKREDKTTPDDANTQKNIFVSLRKAANHPLLLRMRHTSQSSINHLSEMLHRYGYFGRDATCTRKLVQKELENFSDYDVHCAALDLIDEDPSRQTALSKYILEEEDLFCSPKFVRLHSLLPRLISENHRMLIFSQWTRCLDLLGCLMESMNLKFLRLDGQTAIPERQKLIDEFNWDSSISVFLLSTRAGGMGINLTAADTCILHDLDFNPFNDIQAEDRCHRIGQKKPVTIMKMVTEGTVDADIYAMQERKSKMNAAIFEDENGTMSDVNVQKGKSSRKKNQSKKDDEVEITRIVQSAMDRFLSSPASKHKNGKRGMIV